PVVPPGVDSSRCAFSVLRSGRSAPARAMPPRAPAGRAATDPSGYRARAATDPGGKMRLVHAADIHLDSPLRGLTRLGDGDLARLLRQATRRALENLVDLTVDQNADAL